MRELDANAGLRRGRSGRLFGGGVLVVLLAAWALACGDARPGAAGDGSSSCSDVLYAPCADEGTARSCKLYLGQENGIASCRMGNQACENGRWTECGGGSVTVTSIPIDP